LCRELDIPCPRAALPASPGEAEDFARQVGFPLVAKLATPWRSAGVGLRSTAVLGGREELARAQQACQRARARLLLQEYIPSAPAQDWFFHAYCDARSSVRPAFTGRKERSYPAHAGLTSFGLSVDNPGLRRQATSLLERVGFRGICDLDFRCDPRDGQYKLLDFNPRLGAQFRLFRNTAGVDVALAAHQDLTGRAVPDGAQVDGRRFLVENYDPIAAFGYRRRGELDLRSWLVSLWRVDESAWFAPDDLAPFGLMCLRMGWRALTRPFARDPRPHGRTEPRYRPGRAAFLDVVPADAGDSSGRTGPSRGHKGGQ